MTIIIDDWDGYCHSSKEVEITEEEFKDIYTNEHEAEFLKHEGNLYIRTGIWGSPFERVRSESQIDEAFNPDRAAFERWRKKT